MMGNTFSPSLPPEELFFVTRLSSRRSYAVESGLSETTKDQAKTRAAIADPKTFSGWRLRLIVAAENRRETPGIGDVDRCN